MLAIGRSALGPDAWVVYLIAGGLAAAIGYRISKGDFTASITSKYSEES